MHARQVYIEVSRKNSPTGRMLLKEYPNDDRPRTLRISSSLLAALAEQRSAAGLGPRDLMWSTEAGTPIASNTFRTRMWLSDTADVRLSWSWHYRSLPAELRGEPS